MRSLSLAIAIGFVALFVVTGSTSRAGLDGGAPLYRLEDAAILHAEVLYNQYDRKVEAAIDKVTLTAPSLPPATVFNPDAPDIDGAMAIAMVRLNLLLSERFTLYGDAGSASGDAMTSATVFGAGLRYGLIENESIRFSFVTAFHLVPSHDVDLSYANGTNAPIAMTGQRDFFEVGIGIIGSGEYELAPDVLLMPYGGIALSLLRGSVDYSHEYEASGLTESGSGDIQEDSPMSITAGLSLQMSKRFTVHLEGSFMDGTSVGAGVGILF